MGRNLMFLGVLVWAANSMAKAPVVHQPKAEWDSYKVAKPVEEQEGRSVAGEKKKKQQWKEESKTETEESDSEVRYWQYQE